VSLGALDGRERLLAQTLDLVTHHGLVSLASCVLHRCLFSCTPKLHQIIKGGKERIAPARRAAS
jgi:hypothetical protein